MLFSFFDLEGDLLGQLPENVDPHQYVLLPELVDIRGRLLVLRGTIPRKSSADWFEWYDCTGAFLGRTANSAKAGKGTYWGAAFAQGADGSIYATTFPDDNSGEESDLVAFDEDMNEKWRAHLAGVFKVLGGHLSLILDENGVIYVPMANKDPSFYGLGVLVAVQTESPGLADTSWPTVYHDVGASSWAGAESP